MYTFENEITNLYKIKVYTLPVEVVFWDDLEDVLEPPLSLPGATNI